jgi:phage major head subunit gpT-like protein
MTVFKTSRGVAAPVRREEMDVRSRRVSNTYAWMGTWSKR